MADDAPKNDYILHNQTELTRLAAQHPIIKDAMDNPLVWAPIDWVRSPMQILDLCTADGTGSPVRYCSQRYPAYLCRSRYRRIVLPSKLGQEYLVPRS